MPTERHVMLNPNAAPRRPPFESARALIGDDEPRGRALIVAQAAVEVAFEKSCPRYSRGPRMRAFSWSPFERGAVTQVIVRPRRADTGAV